MRQIPLPFSAGRTPSMIKVALVSRSRLLAQGTDSEQVSDLYLSTGHTLPEDI